MGGEAQLMSHPWKIDAQTLESALAIPVLLLNDFHAQAFAVPRLGPHQWEGLDELEPRARTYCPLGCRHGLGRSRVHMDRPRVLPRSRRRQPRAIWSEG